METSLSFSLFNARRIRARRCTLVWKQPAMTMRQAQSSDTEAADAWGPDVIPTVKQHK